MSNDPISPQRLRKLGIAVWVGILILVGTYFRVRPQDIVPEADWLIKAQLSACFLGGVLGILLILKHAYLGFGGKVLLVSQKELVTRKQQTSTALLETDWLYL